MTITIDPGETVTIVGPKDPRGTYSVSVEEADVRLHNLRQQVRQGELLRPGEEGELEVHKKDGRIFAHNPSDNATTAVLTARKTEFTLFKRATTIVSGGSGPPVDVSIGEPVETDNYGKGGAFDEDGTAYPYTVDPAETIQELMVTDCGDVVARITTDGGVTFDYPLAGQPTALNFWRIDSVEFRDPNGTGARIAGGWAGE